MAVGPSVRRLPNQQCCPRTQKTASRGRSCTESEKPESTFPAPFSRGNSRWRAAGQCRPPKARRDDRHPPPLPPQGDYGLNSRRIPTPPCPPTKEHSRHQGRLGRQPVPPPVPPR